MIDDKLKEIKVYPTNNGFLPEHAIAQIKKCFVDAGYQTVLIHDLDGFKGENATPLLSGKQWYDRFEKELDTIDAIGDLPDGLTLAQRKEFVARRIEELVKLAGRKAAGL